MVAQELISEDLPPLRTKDSCMKALGWMNEFRVSHLPVVKNGKFMGLISEDEIFDVSNPEISIEDSEIVLSQLFSKAEQHVYEVMKLMADNELSVVPIIDKDEKYLGATSLTHVMELITHTGAIAMPGSVLVVEIDNKNYSLAQIAQIVESNNAKILSSYITSSLESTEIEVTLKVNVKDLSRIIPTFIRYGYHVKESYHQSLFNDNLKDRYDALINYLNI